MESLLFGHITEREEEEHLEEHQPAPRPPASSNAAPVWHDSDDDDVEVDLAVGANRLRKLAREEDVVEEEADDGDRRLVLNTRLTGTEYQKRLRERAGASTAASSKSSKSSKANANAGGPSWAAQLRARAQEEDTGATTGATDALRGQVGGLLASRVSRARIPPNHLEVTKLSDANKASPSSSVLTSIKFHPGETSSPLFMTSSLDRRLRFFGVDGVQNPHIQSVFFEDMPITGAAFTKRGAGVLACGRRKFFYCLDLETSKMEKVAGIFGREEKSFERFISSDNGDGKNTNVVAFVGDDGTLPLVSVDSRQCVGTLRMNGTVRAGAWSADGRYLAAGGGDGVICVWDMRHQRRCVRAFRDEGSLGVTSVGASAGGLLAVGSSSGIVNVYRDVWKEAGGSGGGGGGGGGAGGD